jgi:DNA-directed RNA polymerase subunit beta'
MLMTKRALKKFIGGIIERTNFEVTAAFLDRIKELGYYWSFKGGLSFNLGDLINPTIKESTLVEASTDVDEVWDNYNMGLITNNERYNQIIDKWTFADNKITENLMKELAEHKDGFNSVYMMLDSGARGSKQQIKQLCGLRGLMAKPRKSGDTGGAIIENPILSNFLEGLSVLEYFISTHGARKGLADTALKTADAGYLTRRLVDVSQDVIINETDCQTLRGIDVTALKENENVVQTLSERIRGRYSLGNIYHPVTDEIMLEAAEYIDEKIANAIDDAGVELVRIRSVLTCEAMNGVCAKCYGKNLATGRIANLGDSVGIIAAQSIGEPGTQLTLRTFHVGGIASVTKQENQLISKFEGKVEFDNVKTITYIDDDSQKSEVVISRSGEMRIVDADTGKVFTTLHIPYGSTLMVKDKKKIVRDDVICEWDPFNAVIISEFGGVIQYEDIDEGQTFRIERDDQTGYVEKVVIESKNKKKIPTLKVVNSKGKELKNYNLPVGAYISVENGAEVRPGDKIVKIPRKLGSIQDITGGLPRVTELFEARNPSNPAVTSEIDGIVSFGKIKRGNREVFVEDEKTEQKRKYLIGLSKHILVQEGDFVRAGTQLSDGATAPADILSIKGPFAVQTYLVNGIQEVYRSQGITINDKHIEVIVRQMMRRVEIEDPGDTIFLEGEAVEKVNFNEQNDWIFDKKFVTGAGESDTMKAGQLVSIRQLREENSLLKRNDKKIVEFRDAVPATAKPMLQGITKSSLGVVSWISAASFQETTKVLSTAAIGAKRDLLNGLKENVIVGKLIPAGTGMKQFRSMKVLPKEIFEEETEGETEEVAEAAIDM